MFVYTVDDIFDLIGIGILITIGLGFLLFCIIDHIKKKIKSRRKSKRNK